jgi:Type IV secretion system pilin
MKNKKNIAILLAIFALGAGLMIFAPHLALGATDKYGLSKTASSAGIETKNASLTKVVGSVIMGALALVGVVFLILMIYAGYIWMIARGNTEKVERSMDTIKAAVIGIVIIALAYAITDFVINQAILSGTNSSGGTCPETPCTPPQYCDMRPEAGAAPGTGVCKY